MLPTTPHTLSAKFCRLTCRVHPSLRIPSGAVSDFVFVNFLLCLLLIRSSSCRRCGLPKRQIWGCPCLGCRIACSSLARPARPCMTTCPACLCNHLLQHTPTCTSVSNLMLLVSVLVHILFCLHRRIPSPRSTVHSLITGSSSLKPQLRCGLCQGVFGRIWACASFPPLG